MISATTYGLDAIGRIASRARPGRATETYSIDRGSETAWRIDDRPTLIEAAIEAADSRIAARQAGALGYSLFDLRGSIAIRATCTIRRSISPAHPSADSREVKALNDLENALGPPHPARRHPEPVEAGFDRVGRP